MWTDSIKVDVDGLSVTDVEDTIGLGGEPGPHLASRPLEMLLESQLCVLCQHVAVCCVIFTRFMEMNLFE